MIYFLVFNSWAQENIHVKSTDTSQFARHTIYAEGLGNAFWYSVNYDAIFYHHKKIALSGRIGVSYLPTRIGFSLHSYTVPIQASFLYGYKHHLELGLGYSYTYVGRSEKFSTIYQLYGAATVFIGYRYQKPTGGLFIKTGLLTFLPFENYPPLWLSFGIGYTFKNKSK